MSNNGGPANPRNSLSDSESPRDMRSTSVIAEARLSVDSERSSSSSPPIDGPNGMMNGRRHDADDGNLDPVQKLQRELQRTNEEKEQLATQYRALLAKLTTLRTTIGTKLKQDAVRLSQSINTFILLIWCWDMCRRNLTDENSRCSSLLPRIMTYLRR